MSREISPPFASVIIPTYNRKDSLRLTLDSLAHQTYAADHFEVIVVDDGGSDDTASVMPKRPLFALRYVRQQNQGAAAARNRGAVEARGEILIFLDDDIRVVPEFIEAMVAALDAPQPTVAVGSLQPPEWEKSHPFRDRYARLTASAPEEEIAFVDCLSGIFAVGREDFWRIGGMQDVAGDGRTAWGDVDFGYRAQRLGYRFRRAVQAMGRHDDRAISDLATYCQVQEQASQQAVILFEKYPDLSHQIPMFRDKTPIDWREDALPLILRKLARQALSSPPAMGFMQSAVLHLERHAPSSRALDLLYRWIISGCIYRGYRRGLHGRQGDGS